MEAQGWEEAGCLLLTLGESGEVACICQYSGGRSGLEMPDPYLGDDGSHGMLEAGVK